MYKELCETTALRARATMLKIKCMLKRESQPLERTLERSWHHGKSLHQDILPRGREESTMRGNGKTYTFLIMFTEVEDN